MCVSNFHSKSNALGSSVIWKLLLRCCASIVLYWQVDLIIQRFWCDEKSWGFGFGNSYRITYLKKEGRRITLHFSYIKSAKVYGSVLVKLKSLLVTVALCIDCLLPRPHGKNHPRRNALLKIGVLIVHAGLRFYVPKISPTSHLCDIQSKHRICSDKKGSCIVQMINFFNFRLFIFWRT